MLYKMERLEQNASVEWVRSNIDKKDFDEVVKYHNLFTDKMDTSFFDWKTIMSSHARKLTYGEKDVLVTKNKIWSDLSTWFRFFVKNSDETYSSYSIKLETDKWWTWRLKELKKINYPSWVPSITLGSDKQYKISIPENGAEEKDQTKIYKESAVLLKDLESKKF